MLLLLLSLGTLAGWAVVRLGALLPTRAHGTRHPVFVWSLTLPVWIVLAGVTAAFAPTAGYLWTLPLLVAGIGLLAVPVEHVPVLRAISVLVLAVSGTLWLRDNVELLRFVVAVFGRLPLITPVWAYAALMAACGAMVVPPFIAAAAATKPIVRPSLVTAVLLVAVVVAAGLAYAAPAYTFAQPQRRHARVIVEPDATTATYEVASQEPGLDLDLGAPVGWYRATDPPVASVPAARLAQPFVFRTTAPSPGPPPGAISELSLKEVSGGTELTMTITPSQAGLSAVFVAPEGVLPQRSNLPGRMIRGRWTALYFGVPTDGATWHASFKSGVESKLPASAGVIMSSRFPGGTGWQSLPAWLPQDHAVWDLDVAWILKTPPVIPPVPAIR